MKSLDESIAATKKNLEQKITNFEDQIKSEVA